MKFTQFLHNFEYLNFPNLSWILSNFRDSSGSFGILREFSGFSGDSSGFFRIFGGFFGILRDFSGFFGILGGFFGILQDSSGFFGIFGIFHEVSGFFGISWISVFLPTLFYREFVFWLFFWGTVCLTRIADTSIVFARFRRRNKFEKRTRIFYKNI